MIARVLFCIYEYIDLKALYSLLQSQLKIMIVYKIIMFVCLFI